MNKNTTMNFRKRLKNLTPEQCIEIAKFEQPFIDWKYVKSKYLWEGHDLIPNGKEVDRDIQIPIFQIDYSQTNNPIFKFYDPSGNLHPVLSSCEIIDYIYTL